VRGRGEPPGGGLFLCRSKGEGMVVPLDAPRGEKVEREHFLRGTPMVHTVPKAPREQEPTSHSLP
jgi:hypothetical protein